LTTRSDSLANLAAHKQQVLSSPAILNPQAKYPFSLGCEFAGVVEALHTSDGNSSFSVGDNVCGVSLDLSHDDTKFSHTGSFAEYILFPLAQLVHIPQPLSLKEAAAIGIAGLTAFQLLFDCAKISANSNILILGGSSSIGSLSIQLAKLTGARVSATCSGRAMKYTRQFGADQLIDYQSLSWDNIDNLKGLDAVIDTVGEPDAFSRARQHSVISATGVFVSVASFDAGFNASGHPPLSFASFYRFRSDPFQHAQLLNLLATGKLRVCIDREFCFSEEGVRALIRYQQRGASLGKNLLLFDALATYHGSCACGGVTFQVAGRPEASLVCHCLECQRLVSGLFAAFFLYDRVTLTCGEDFLTSCGSARGSRCHYFCRVCGTCLYLRHPGTSSHAILMTSLGDMPFRPLAHVHYQSRRQRIADSLPKYSGWMDQIETENRGLQDP
jgi:NADPH:quinone reductase-like Zn-dependent oxidoreductase